MESRRSPSRSRDRSPHFSPAETSDRPLRLREQLPLFPGVNHGSKRQSCVVATGSKEHSIYPCPSGWRNHYRSALLSSHLNDKGRWSSAPHSHPASRPTNNPHYNLKRENDRAVNRSFEGRSLCIWSIKLVFPSSLTAKPERAHGLRARVHERITPNCSPLRSAVHRPRGPSDPIFPSSVGIEGVPKVKVS